LSGGSDCAVGADIGFVSGGWFSGLWSSTPLAGFGSREAATSGVGFSPTAVESSPAAAACVGNALATNAGAAALRGSATGISTRVFPGDESEVAAHCASLPLPSGTVAVSSAHPAESCGEQASGKTGGRAGRAIIICSGTVPSPGCGSVFFSAFESARLPPASGPLLCSSEQSSGGASLSSCAPGAGGEARVALNAL
jgi:hypothetical protein